MGICCRFSVRRIRWKDLSYFIKNGGETRCLKTKQALFPKNSASSWAFYQSLNGISLSTVCAILLSYYSVGIIKQKLVCTATDPELCQCLPKVMPIQALSNIMILLALFFYVGLSGESLRQAKRQCNPRQVHNSSLNHTANLLVLIAGMIRFGLLVTQDDTELSL